MVEPVLLTGATGFVGRAVLVDLVARGVPVHAVARRAGVPMPGVTWHQADLLQTDGRAAVAGLARRMIHCAWYVEHGAFWASPLNAVWAAASVDLAARFVGAGGRRIVAVGTCAEYARVVEGEGLAWPESRAIEPATPYGQAKAGLHQALTAVCPGLVWARLFHLYGPGEPAARLVPSLMAALREGRPAEVRAAELVRDFSSTAHVAWALTALLDSDCEGSFNIGSGTALTLGDLARILARLAGRPDLLRLSHNPPAGEPAVMVPDLARLWAVVGRRVEDPAVGLRG